MGSVLPVRKPELRVQREKKYGALATATRASAIQEERNGRLAAVMAAGYDPSCLEAIARTSDDYHIFCAGLKLPARPLSFESVAHFLDHSVLGLKNTPEYAGQQLSHLRKAAALEHWGNVASGCVMDESDEVALTMLRRGLAKLGKHNNPKPRKQPIRLSHLAALAGRLAAMGYDTTARSDLSRLFTEMLVAHGGMLRTKEHTARNLKVRNVTFYSYWQQPVGPTTPFAQISGIGLDLINTKTGKFDAEPQRVFLPVRLGAAAAVCPVRHLWAYFRHHDLFAPYHADEPLFVVLDSNGARGGCKPTTYERFVDDVRKLLPLIGLNPKDYAGHSFQAGGCTDAFDSGVPGDVIITQGRWKSDAWKRYRRSTPEMLGQLARVIAVPLLHAFPVAPFVPGNG